ncbi:hypothetical protein B0J14DRAFT_27465 [Halenospora varia]|nr:hypothetical protein B0J14DRAFT_27465 [Halenospora varia]
MDDVELHEKNAPPKQRKISSLWKSHWAFASFVALGFLALISFQSLYNTFHLGNDLAYQDCGTTPAEAKAQGCIFDRINYGWTPPACLDTELEDSTYREAMKRGGEWRWYLDSNTTQEIPQDWEDLSKQTHVWTEHRYHVLHCLYTWKILHRAAMRDSVIYAFVGNYGHTTHCSDMLLDEATRSGEHAKGVNVMMVFTGCMALVSK